MSLPFSIGYADHQSAAAYEELRNAYNQRRWALGQPLRCWDAANDQWINGNTPVAVGDRIQHHMFFYEIQLWIVNNCGWFLNPAVSDYSGSSYIKNIFELARDYFGHEGFSVFDAFEYFCKEIVGGALVGETIINDHGFRQWVDHTLIPALNWPSPSEFNQIARASVGRMFGTGHLRGNVVAKLINEVPWCVTDDICTCLSGLRATKIRAVATSEADEQYAAVLIPASGYGEYVEATDYYTGDNTNYDSQTPTAYGDYSYSFKQQSGSYGQHRENGSCQVQYYIPPGMNSLINSAKLYYKVKKYGGDFSGFDIISHENAYNYVLSLPYTSSGELISPLILRLSGADFDNELVYQYSGLGFQAYGEAGVSDLIGVALWNFTNGITW